MALDFRLPLEEDILELLAHLSIEDKRELQAQGVDIEWAIRYSVRNSSECVAALEDGKCMLITGLVVEDGLVKHVYPWLLGTPALQKYPRQVLKHSKLLLNRWRALHPFMFNYVDARHHRAIAWLTHLGASFEFIPEHGVFKRPFYKFSFGSET